MASLAAPLGSGRGGRVDLPHQASPTAHGRAFPAPVAEGPGRVTRADVVGTHPKSRLARRDRCDRVDAGVCCRATRAPRGRSICEVWPPPHRPRLVVDNAGAYAKRRDAVGAGCGTCEAPVRGIWRRRGARDDWRRFGRGTNDRSRAHRRGSRPHRADRLRPYAVAAPCRYCRGPLPDGRSAGARVGTGRRDSFCLRSRPQRGHHGFRRTAILRPRASRGRLSRGCQLLVVFAAGAGGHDARCDAGDGSHDRHVCRRILAAGHPDRPWRQRGAADARGSTAECAGDRR